MILKIVGWIFDKLFWMALGISLVVGYQLKFGGLC